MIGACDSADITLSEKTPTLTTTRTPQREATTAPSLLARPEPSPKGRPGILMDGVVETPQASPAMNYARLVAVDPRDGTLYGDLANRIEQVSPLELVIQIRDDAFFHPSPNNGNAQRVSASDIARDFEIRADANEFLFKQVIVSVEVPESNTLHFRLRGPFALLFEFLGDSESASIRSQINSPSGLPIGGGPFIPERREDRNLSLRAHPLYHHRDLPALDEIQIVSAEHETVLDAAFATGSLDIRRLNNTESIARAGERLDARTLTRTTRQMRGLGLSLVGSKGGTVTRFHEAFQDERVRRAIFLSLNHEELAQFENGPTPYPVGAIGPAFSADALPSDELSAHRLYQHNPAEAHKLLEAAGAHGISFTLEAPERATLTKLANVLVRQLRKGGLQPKLAKVPTEIWERNLTSGNFESILFELEPFRTPDMGLRLHTSVGLNGLFSPWGYSNPVFDQAVQGVMNTIEPKERAQRARDAQQTLLEGVPPVVPLPEPVEQIAISSRLGGYIYDTHEFNETWGSSRWHLLNTTTSHPLLNSTHS
jgi:ABC-type transport system substrate-binding protein